MAMTNKAQNWRNGLIRKIKTIQRRRLGMSDEQYRTMLGDRYGKDSATQLSIGELKDLASHLAVLSGERVEKPKADPQAQKIWALWQELHRIGVVKNPTEQALNKFIKRQGIEVESYKWLNRYQASTIIESLKKWSQRYA